MAAQVLTKDWMEPLNGATTAQINIHAGDGNLTIGSAGDGAEVLARGTLQYLEKQGAPTSALEVKDAQATLTLRGGRGRQPWLHLPWAACNGATRWQIELHPKVAAQITAHSDGGNLNLDLADMAVTYVAAATGGGNVEVALPDRAAGLCVTAKTGGGQVTVEFGRFLMGSNIVQADSGAGNVTVRLPSGTAARVHATSGLGRVVVNEHWPQIGQDTYQSPDYDSAANRVDISARSGAGNVSIETH